MGPAIGEENLPKERLHGAPTGRLEAPRHRTGQEENDECCSSLGVTPHHCRSPDDRDLPNGALLPGAAPDEVRPGGDSSPPIVRAVPD